MFNVWNIRPECCTVFQCTAVFLLFLYKLMTFFKRCMVLWAFQTQIHHCHCILWYQIALIFFYTLWQIYCLVFWHSGEKNRVQYCFLQIWCFGCVCVYVCVHVSDSVQQHSCNMLNIRHTKTCCWNNTHINLIKKKTNHFYTKCIQHCLFNKTRETAAPTFINQHSYFYSVSVSQKVLFSILLQTLLCLKLTYTSPSLSCSYDALRFWSRLLTRHLILK
jgi:hypothetical protein